MSLDGAFLHIVKTELNQLTGAKIEKIHQPSREEIILTFRGKKLLVSANSESARICFTDGGFDNPAMPPMFCVLMRKHLGNGRLSSVTQPGLERVIYLDFECTNEIGDAVKNRLAVEIMGRNSNIILINETGKIIDGIKRVSDVVSSVRLILPGVDYEPPPRDYGRYCLLDREISEIPLVSDAKTLLKTLEGVSPIFAREAVYRGNLAEFLQKAKTMLINNTPEITLVSEKDGTPKDFCFVDILQYGDALTTARFDSANELLDKFFAEKAARERLKQRSGGLMKTLSNSYERLKRKLAAQKQELLDCAEKETFKVYGDLVNANIYKLKKGDEFLEAENYVTGEAEKIKLDPRLTPAQNAQKFYLTYRKLCNAEKKLAEIISGGERELVYLESVIDSAERASCEAELDEIRAEISKDSHNNAGKKTIKKSKPLPPLKYAASDGTEILVGRNNRQNDELTFKIAAPDDIWLHTKDIAGSHVILRCSGKTVGGEVLTEAARIAASCSKARDSSRVPVDYTFRKFVKKPGGSKPGYVIFTNNKTLYVTPGKEDL